MGVTCPSKCIVSGMFCSTVLPCNIVAMECGNIVVNLSDYGNNHSSFVKLRDLLCNCEIKGFVISCSYVIYGVGFGTVVIRVLI